MKKNNSQIVNSFLIIAGGAILLFQISGEEDNPYILIAGLVMLMYGLYRATNHWVIANEEGKEETKEEEEKEN